jgi:hypothetical protein
MRMTHHNNTKFQAQSDYQRALREALWHKVSHWRGRGCNDLLSFNEVFVYLKKQPQIDLGLQSVPLEQIVGSTGRYEDFDLAYNPRHKASEDRWVNVAETQYKGVELPPILLYKVGQAYFVEDGNNRVSVAHQNGKKYIQSRVIEIDVSNIKPDPSCTRLGYKLDDKTNC